MKLVLANPGVGPFAQQAARALLESGHLASYWTTFADRPDARWRRATVRLAALTGVDLERELARRTISEVPASLVRQTPFWEIVRSLLSRARVDPRIVDAVWDHETDRFDRRIAAQGLDNADGVYGYEYNILASFEAAHRRGLARVYEVPSPLHDFAQAVTEREIDRFPELDDGKRNYFRKRRARRGERVRSEWNLAQVVIANSTFTRESYAAAGFDIKNVRVVPLGSPPVDRNGAEGGSSRDQPLRVLWAGSFGVHKGAHYLLAAWRTLAAGDRATLAVYGSVSLPQGLLNDLPASIRISPTVPRDELFDHYRAADVLMFPTLCDGFGMVVTEAFAHGLPVITTARAGAADLVRHGENGLIVPAGDAHALTEALAWCLSHRAELRAMRKAACETAARWQWSDFRKALARNVVDGLRDAGYAA